MNESNRTFSCDHLKWLYLYHFQGSASSGSLLVSDEPYTADDGFLPVSPSSISMSGDGEATISHYTDELNGRENLWGSEDVVMYDEDEEEQDNTAAAAAADDDDGEEEQEEEPNGVIVRVMTEPDLEELSFRERILAGEKNESELRASDQFEQDWSGHFAEEDFSVGEEEDDEISDAQQVIHLKRREGEESLQREFQPPVSEGEEEHGEHTGGGEEGDRMIASEVEQKNDNDDDDDDVVYDREMTWYFTWR